MERICRRIQERKDKIGNIIFKAEPVVEEYWDVVINGVSMNIPDRHMRELCVRYAKKNKLRLVEANGDDVKGMF